MNLDPNLLPKVLDFVKISSAVTKRALDELSALKQVQTEAAEKAPALAQKMVTAGAIDEGQEKQAADMIGSHCQVVDLLGKAVDRIGELSSAKKAAGDLGMPEDNDNGRGNVDPNWSLNSSIVGARTSEKKASDVAFLKGLGLAG